MDDFDGNEPQEEEEEDDWLDTRWSAAPEDSEAPPVLYSKQLKDVASSSTVNASKITDEKSNVSRKTCAGAQVEDEKSTKEEILSRMALNDHKAGMEGLDRESINKVILEASKGSRFYENELKKEQQVNLRVDEHKKRMECLTAADIKYGEQQADSVLVELEKSRDLSRHIVHIDMDAFYAAVEMRDNPSLKSKPMAVGSTGMLSTSNYLARRFGVRAAMPGFIGKKLCPNLVIVPENFEKYNAVSRKVRAVMADYDPKFCPMSLDEAYLDVTECVKKRSSSAYPTHYYSNGQQICGCSKQEILKAHEEPVPGQNEEDDSSALINTTENRVSNAGVTQPKEEQSDKDKSGQKASNSNASSEASSGMCSVCGNMLRTVTMDVKSFGCCDEEVVREMRYRIEMVTQLTASAGLAANTMIAKICSDKNKPNGQYKVPSNREAIMKFMEDLPLRKVSGIGKVSEKMLTGLGVHMCSDLYHKRGLLYHLYSATSFNYFMRIAAGIGSTRIESDSERKSMSVERTFHEINKANEMLEKCQELSENLSEDLKDEDLMGKTVTLKLKTVAFELKTRAQTLSSPTNSVDVIYRAATELLRTEIQNCHPGPLRLRLMGVRMSNLVAVSSVEAKKQNSIKEIFQRVSQKNVPRVDDVAAGIEASLRTAQAEQPPAMLRELGMDAGSTVMPVEPAQAESDVHKLEASHSITSKYTSGEPSTFNGVPATQNSIKDLFLRGQTKSKAITASKNTCIGEPDVSDDVASATQNSIEDLFIKNGNNESVGSCNTDSSLMGSGSLASGNVQTSQRTPQKPFTVCPVCGKEIRSRSMNIVHIHIDKCLTQQDCNQDNGGISTEPTETTLENVSGLGEGSMTNQPNIMENLPGESMESSDVIGAEANHESMDPEMSTQPFPLASVAPSSCTKDEFEKRSEAVQSDVLEIPQMSESKHLTSKSVCRVDSEDSRFSEDQSNNNVAHIVIKKINQSRKESTVTGVESFEDNNNETSSLNSAISQHKCESESPKIPPKVSKPTIPKKRRNRKSKMDNSTFNTPPVKAKPTEVIYSELLSTLAEEKEKLISSQRSKTTIAPSSEDPGTSNSDPEHSYKFCAFSGLTDVKVDSGHASSGLTEENIEANKVDSSQFQSETVMDIPISMSVTSSDADTTSACVSREDEPQVAPSSTEKPSFDTGEDSLYTTSTISCPVCAMPQAAEDLVAFNDHVDHCLNRRAIRDMLKEQDSSAYGKRSCDDSVTPPSKRKKSAGVRTIDSFFKTGSRR